MHNTKTKVSLRTQADQSHGVLLCCVEFMNPRIARFNFECLSEILAALLMGPCKSKNN